MRAFVSMQVGEKSFEYRHIDTILASPDKTETMLADAIRELDSFKRKYSTLHELAAVFAAIDGLLEGGE